MTAPFLLTLLGLIINGVNSEAGETGNHSKFHVHWERTQNSSNICNLSVVKEPVGNTQKWFQYVQYSVYESLHTVKGVFNGHRTHNVIIFISLLKSIIRNAHLRCAPTFVPMLSDGNQLFHAPCHSIYYPKEYEIQDGLQTMEWYISVYKDFWLNITIHEAFVPFNKGCRSAYISVVERFVSAKSTHQNFCGHIDMESVYIKHNQALVQLHNRMYYATIIFQYHIHDMGSVYLTSIGHGYHCLQEKVHSNVSPSLILFIRGHVTNVWFLSNGLYSLQNVKGNSHMDVMNSRFKVDTLPPSNMPFMVKMHILVNKYTCTPNKSYMDVYPGLLSLYWMKWREKPYKTLNCNVLQQQLIDLSFHLKITLVASFLLDDAMFSINMSFYTSKYLDIFNKEILSSGNSNSALHRHGFFTYGLIKTKFGQLTFRSFVEAKVKTTAQASIHYIANSTSFTQGRDIFAMTEGDSEALLIICSYKNVCTNGISECFA